MTRAEILQAIEDLTAQIRTLSYSSSKRSGDATRGLTATAAGSTRPVRDTLR